MINIEILKILYILSSFYYDNTSYEFNNVFLFRSNVIPDVNHPCIRPEQRPMISFVLNNQLMEMNAVLLLLAPEVR